MKPVLSQNVMGNLPADRVRPNRAFHTTGVDFCGPFYCKSEVKNCPTVKCYTYFDFYMLLNQGSGTKLINTMFFIRYSSLFEESPELFDPITSNFVGAKNKLNDLKQKFLTESH